MTDVQTHRGPDDRGVRQHGPVALGHRRLSIIDLSPMGHQPMSNEDGTVWIVYNGEIYNFHEVEAELRARGHVFRSRCDTETIIHAYEEWGPDCLKRFNGMFAFAIHDQKTGRVFMARDRLGVKPLYYWVSGEKLLVASEMKALLECPLVTRSVNRAAVADYLALRYVPGPATLIENIQKFPAAHYATWENGRLEFQRYWQIPSHEPLSLSKAEWEEKIAEELRAAVRRRLISDVPFGAYLSGGLDSSVITALMAQELREPVRTFSIGFDSEHDELSDARFTAEHLGCKHTEMLCRPEDMFDLPKVIWHLDEPIGDAIVLPLFLLAREAKKSVSMVLTGEGADEIFGGYFFHRVFHLMGHLEARLCDPKWIGMLVERTPASLVNRLFDYPGDIAEKGRTKIAVILERWSRLSCLGRYRLLMTLFGPEDWRQLTNVLPEPEWWLPGEKRTAPGLDEYLDLQYRDWLPDVILHKQDKMSMAYSIEGRVPFMDYQLVEMAARIPHRLKISAFAGKKILRSTAARFLPKAVLQRKKKPFYVPLDRYWQEPKIREFWVEIVRDSVLQNVFGIERAYIDSLLTHADRQDFLYLKQIFSLTMLALWGRATLTR